VALLATGSELREPGEPLKQGEIYESNRGMLAGLLRALGSEPIIFPVVRDNLEETTAALSDAFTKADVVISTGGVSVGEFDFVKDAFEQLGGTIDLWKVAMRPGKPFVFGRLGEKYLFGLPGNPVSAFVTFIILVRPALLTLQGAKDLELPSVPGELVESVSNRGDRRHFARVRWTKGKVQIAGPQKSHLIGSLAEANGLLDLPPGAELKPGAVVQVLLWDALG
jgi:molybdopterin molybdotransferase